MSSLLEHCHGENWKSPTRSFERSGKAKRTFRETKKNQELKHILPMKPNGKSICAALKQVRKRVADTNGIVYAPKECHFEGDCNGTCPACEAEVRYLEHQLNLLRKAGKAVTVMGVALGMTLTTGCKQGNSPNALQEKQDSVQSSECQDVDGLFVPEERATCSEPDADDEDVTGMISPDTTSDKQGQKNTKRKRKVRMVTKFVPPANK